MTPAMTELNCVLKIRSAEFINLSNYELFSRYVVDPYEVPVESTLLHLVRAK